MGPSTQPKGFVSQSAAYAVANSGKVSYVLEGRKEYISRLSLRLCGFGKGVVYSR